MQSRVCHISTVHAPFDQRIFHRACWTLRRAGYDVHLLVQLDTPDATRDGIEMHAVGAPKAHTLGLRITSRISRLLRAAKVANALGARVYHLHDPELIPVGLWLKATTRAAVVFDCHENNVGYLLQKKYLHPLVRRAMVVGMTALEHAAARCFDAIVAADEGVGELFRTRYSARNVVVVHNFPRLDLFKVGVADLDSAKRFDLVYHGTIPRYHLDIAFAVAEELRRRSVTAKWLFFGKCPEIGWARAELQRRGLEAEFELDAVPVPHEQVAARVSQARIGFIPLPDLPKFQHNIPTKLFEFMLLGMPTILSDLPPSRPFVGDGACAVMVPPDDIQGYAQAIEDLLNDESRMREMGTAARQRVIDRFSWECESVKLLRLYSELMPVPRDVVHEMQARQTASTGEAESAAGSDTEAAASVRETVTRAGEAVLS